MLFSCKVSSREFNDRFEREAKAISAINHPNICTLYDIGTSSDAPGYLVMESSRASFCRRGSSAVRCIHRDLQPGNIIITRNGVKVLDFAWLS